MRDISEIEAMWMIGIIVFVYLIALIITRISLCALYVGGAKMSPILSAFWGRVGIWANILSLKNWFWGWEALGYGPLVYGGFCQDQSRNLYFLIPPGKKGGTQ